MPLALFRIPGQLHAVYDSFITEKLSPSGNVNLQITEIATFINNEQLWIYYFF